MAATLAKIREADRDNYLALSLAAKVFYILSSTGKQLTASDIVTEAARVGWRVSAGEIERATDLLVSLGLVA